MDKRLQSIAENFESMKIGLDDSFRFHCTMCGKCCIHREDIILNPYDLFRVSKKLGMEPKDFVARYCEAYLGGSSRMVIVRLRPVGEDRRCPLLEGKKCSVHQAKPAVCALYPLGRGLNQEIGKASEISHRSIQYILQKPDCGDESETHTVREWISGFDFLLEEDFVPEWMQMIMDYGGAVKKLETVHGEFFINVLSMSILGTVYLNYQLDEPFMPQFRKNDKEYREVLAGLLAVEKPGDHIGR